MNKSMINMNVSMNNKVVVESDDAAVVEFVDRLHRQPQRKLLQRPRRFERIDRFDHGRSLVPADP